MPKNKNNRAVRVYRVLQRVNTTGTPFELFVAADERAVEFLRQEMRERNVIFVYRKENGEITERTGTLREQEIGDYAFAGLPKNVYNNPRYLRYYDIDADGWRTAVCDRLIGYFPRQ